MAEVSLGPQLIGRQTEIAQIDRFLDLAQTDTAALILEGEAGIGKTTLWEEGVRRAAAAGFRVLSSRPTEAEANLSFVALADLLEDVTDQELLAVPAPQRRALKVALLRSGGGDAPLESFAIPAGFTAVLQLLSEDAPILVALDDLQWQDRSSAEVMGFAARRISGLRVRFLFARRPGPPPALERALRRHSSQVVTVGPLSFGAVRILLAARLGLRPSRRVLQQIVDAGQGNPLFVLELGRMVAERGTLDVGTGLPMPYLIDALFGARIAGLDPAIKRLLTILALAGDMSLSELEEMDTSAALDEAVDIGVVVVDGQRVRPAHPLLAAAARSAAGIREQRTLNMAIADVAADDARRARHTALATVGTDPDLAETVAAASRQAMARGRADEAAELAEYAFNLTPPDHPQYADRLLSFADGLVRISEFRRLTDVLNERLEELPHGSPRAHAHLQLGFVADTYEHYVQLELALAESGAAPDLRALALATKAYLYSVDRVERLADAEQWAEEALLLAPATNVEAHERALHAVAWVRIMRGESVVEMRERLPALPDGYPHVHRFVDRPFGMQLAFRGEVNQARAVFERLVEFVNDRGDVTSSCVFSMHLCEIDLRAGDLRAASHRLEETGWLGDDPSIVHFHDRVDPIFPAIRGLPDEVERLTAPVIAEIEYSGMRWHSLEALRAKGIGALLTHHPQVAVESLRRVWDHTLREQIQDPGAFPVAGDLVEALVETGQFEEADQVIVVLRNVAASGIHPWAAATLKRAVAMEGFATARTSEDAEVAEESLREASDAFGVAGLRFDRARTLLAGGRWQRRLKHWRRARTLLDEAARAFDEMEATGWAADARAELSRVGGRRAPASDELTPTEKQIVDLAASGLSNKRIAGAVFVTENTVERHLSHAFAKLGVRSRTELAARAPRPSGRGPIEQ